MPPHRAGSVTRCSESMGVHMAEATPFRIALTSAGAVSGGPYSAGVIDFIIEALDAWYAAKPPTPEEQRTGIPSHDVRIDAVSGTSAGAVAAGLFPAAVIRSRNPSGGRIPPLLWEVWVNSLDLLQGNANSQGFLGTSDMQDDGDAIPSLLNAQRLDAIAQTAFSSPWDKNFVYPPWLSRELRIRVCVTNLPGVPYHIPMRGTVRQYGHDMFLHGDYGDFLFADVPASTVPGVTPVDPHGPLGWPVLQNWVLASSAFPVGLAPRCLHSGEPVYAAREWPGYGPKGCKEFNPETALRQGEQLQFPAVDGGMVNNEPFELARQVLLDDVCQHLDREGHKAQGAVVLIDPFPSPYREDDHLPLRHLRADIFDMIPPLLVAMKQQCRFKPAELELASDADTYSRFLVAPAGGGQNGNLDGDDALAGGGLGAFAGFLAQAFREHDYQLGRRNAQQFLRCHFALPLTNGLFARDRARYAPGGDLHYLREKCTDQDKQDHAPIIPLMEPMQQDVTRPPWPKTTEGNIERIVEAMVPRMNTLVQRLGRKACCPAHALLATAWTVYLRRKARKKVQEYISGAMRQRGQM